MTHVAQATGNLAGVAAGGLCFAASPVFAAMAAFSATSLSFTICSPVSAPWSIDRMALMYLLMSVFHLSPWLKLFSVYSQRQIEGE